MLKSEGKKIYLKKIIEKTVFPNKSSSQKQFFGTNFFRFTFSENIPSYLKSEQKSGFLRPMLTIFKNKKKKKKNSALTVKRTVCMYFFDTKYKICSIKAENKAKMNLYLYFKIPLPIQNCSNKLDFKKVKISAPQCTVYMMDYCRIPRGCTMHSVHT